MTTGNTRERAFRRILIREAGTGAGAPAITAAATRLGERLAQQLAEIIGDAGVGAVYGRSLRLARRTFPGLEAGRSSDERGEPFARAQLFLKHQEPAVVADAAVAVLTSVAETLALFIGENLTTRLLRETWPEDFGNVPRRPPHD